MELKKIIRRKLIMYKNKVLNELRTHLCVNKNYFFTTNIIDNIINNIKKEYSNISPIYVIEKAIFNILIPIKYNRLIYSKNKLSIKGATLQYSISRAIISLIKYSKIQFKKSMSDKISLIFIQTYKKNHDLFKNKNIYLNNILNI